jgi:hypothetical protein
MAPILLFGISLFDRKHFWPKVPTLAFHIRLPPSTKMFLLANTAMQWKNIGSSIAPSVGKVELFWVQITELPASYLAKTNPEQKSPPESLTR